ncbi:MAG TPA: hypothetical protein VIX19_00950 [Terriglobales bacterium]
MWQPPSSDYGSSLYIDYPIVPARLDDLTVDTGWPKHPSDDSFIELESVRGDQGNSIEIHSAGKVSKKGERVLVTSFADHRGRPQAGPDVDHGEDPDLLLLPSDDRSDLIGLKLHDGEAFYFSMIEPSTAGRGSFQPTMNGVPADPVDSSDGGLVEAFDAESGNRIKCATTVLESVISCSDSRAERLSTSLALVATMLSPPGLLETVSNDGSRSVLFAVGTTETLHTSTLWRAEVIGSN